MSAAIFVPVTFSLETLRLYIMQASDRALLDHVLAVRTLLGGMTSATGYADAVALRHTELLSMIQQTRISAPVVPELVTSLRQIRWPNAAESMAPLMTAMNSATPRILPATNNHDYQDYTSVIGFYTSRHWLILCGDGDATSKLDCLLDTPVQLDLKVPSEPTVQLLTAVYLASVEGSIDRAIARSSRVKNTTLKFIKRAFKKKISSKRYTMDVLPQSPQELPAATYTRVYGQEVPVACPIDPAKLNELRFGVPMRSSNIALRQPDISKSVELVQHNTGQSTQLLNMLGQLFQQCMNGGDNGGINIFGGRQSRRLPALSDRDAGDMDRQCHIPALPGYQEFGGGDPVVKAKKLKKRKRSVAEVTALILNGIKGKAPVGINDIDDGTTEKTGTKKKKKQTKTENAEPVEAEPVAKKGKKGKKGKKAKKAMKAMKAMKAVAGPVAVPKKAKPAAGPVVVPKKAKPVADKGMAAGGASIKHEASIDRVRCIYACGRSESWSYKGGANGGKAAVLKMARDWLKKQ